MEDAFLAAHARGVSVLVIEPIARALTPWWGAAARRGEGGGKAAAKGKK